MHWLAWIKDKPEAFELRRPQVDVGPWSSLDTKYEAHFKCLPLFSAVADSIACTVIAQRSEH